ncbi:MAG: glycosyltransferase, partial [Caldisericaceae bacterium]
MRAIFYASLALILWHNFFYGLLLVVISIIKAGRLLNSPQSVELPYVSLIVAAHNEEQVIENKIKNSLALDYPQDKLEIIFASDSSTDKTNAIISDFEKKYKNIKLVNIEERAGKVNAYNRAVKDTKGEILAFSDANTIWDKSSLKKLVTALADKRVSCACGHLIYTNTGESEVAYSEGVYWKIENMMKEGESKLYSLTALNGGIYALKKKDYIMIEPLYSHDLGIPLFLGTQKKRTVFVKDALGFERSGTTSEDEIKRKRRMFGRLYSFLFRNPSLFINPFKYDFRYFLSVFSHRTIRYLLPFAHLLLFISAVFLASKGIFFEIIFYTHILFIALAIAGYAMRGKVRLLFLPYYYFLFLQSMLLGFFDFAAGKIKPYWDVAKT